MGLFWLTGISPVQAQDSPAKLPFKMMYEVGFQEDDRRMFNPFATPNRGVGTYQFSLGITKDIWRYKRLILSIGAAYGREENTYIRMFDHCQIPFYLPADGVSCDEVLRHAKRYTYHQIRLNPSMQYVLFRGSSDGFRVYAHLAGVPSFQFRKSYATGYGLALRGRGKWEMAFFSFEMNGGLGFSVNKTDVSFYYRMYNYRRVDRVLFDRDRQIPEDYEARNLFKVGVMVATPLPKLKWLKKKKEGD